MREEVMVQKEKTNYLCALNQQLVNHGIQKRKR